MPFSDITISTFRELSYNVAVAVCVDDGWFKQPHLDGSDWTLGLGEAAQVQPAVSTTHSGRGLLDGNMEHQVMYRDPPTCTTNRSSYSATLNPLSGRNTIKVI
ncbi:unnamed protein product [Arctogadus glacialis]